jgi:hypothetical protein
MDCLNLDSSPDDLRILLNVRLDGLGNRVRAPEIIATSTSLPVPVVSSTLIQPSAFFRHFSLIRPFVLDSPAHQRL